MTLKGSLRKRRQESGLGLFYQPSVYSARVIVFLQIVITGFMGGTLSELIPAVSQVAVVYCGLRKGTSSTK